MTAESVSQLFQKVAELPGGDGPAGPLRDIVGRVQEALRPFLALSLEEFAALLGKVKKPKAPPRPKKTGEEKAAEKAAKAAEKQAQKEADKARKAEEAGRLKALKDAEKEEAKVRKAEDARRLKEAKKAEASVEKLALAQHAAEQVAQGVRALIATFPGGETSKAAVDAGLATLKPMDRTQLRHIAEALQADAGLTDSSTKPQIKKALETKVLRLWKTSQNILH